MPTPIINEKFCIQKMTMKGGWSFVEFPLLSKSLKSPFGWMPVKGTIDGFEIHHLKLWTMKSGNMFMPIKVEVRKIIRKKQGDWVHIILFLDDNPLIIPDAFLACLEDAPTAKSVFFSFSENSQRQFVEWIFAAKHLETRINRITKAIEKLENGLKLHQSSKEKLR